MSEGGEPVRAYRFLLCWFAAYLVFFSLAATKLPNYVLPLYPAVALLTARFLERWRLRQIALPGWVPAVSWGGLVLVGVVTAAGLLIASGVWKLPFGKFPTLPGLERWAVLGLIPLTGAAAWAALRRRRPAVVAAVAATSVAYMAAVAAFPPVELNTHKAPKPLVDAAGACQPDREIRLATLAWFQPTLVFYAGREVQEFHSLADAAAFLATRRPAYLFVPQPVWEKIAAAIPVPHREVARHYDFLKNVDVIVVRNLVE